VIRVEPLDDADVESFFDGSVDANFSVTFYDRLFVAPKGGAGEAGRHHRPLEMIRRWRMRSG
jgi:hypothetical protein